MDSTNNDNSGFLGRGWGFPPQFEKTSKTVVMLEDLEDIKSSLQILLSTVVGERVMDVNYGCNLDSLIFESLDTTTLTIIEDKVKTAILFFEPRIDAKKIKLITDDILEGRIFIEIEYVVRTTNSRYNFVYPFFKNEGTEIQDLITNNPA